MVGRNAEFRAPLLPEIDRQNAASYPDLYASPSVLSSGPNLIINVEQRQAERSHAESRVARYLESLPDQCQMCLASVAMALAVAVGRGELAEGRAKELMGYRRAVAAHHDVLESSPTGRFCDSGRILGVNRGSFPAE